MYERLAARPGEPPRPRPPAFDAPEGTITLREIPALVLGNKLTVVACMAACVLAALVFMITAVPSYLAATQLIIDPTDLRVVDNSLRAQSAFSDTQIAEVENEVRVITSAAVLRRVVESQHLVDDEEFGPREPSLVSRLTALLQSALGGHARDADPVTEAMRVLEKRVAAKREERTFVVTVTVVTRDPAKSARLADAIVTAFLQVTADRRNDATRRVADSLGSRLDGLRQEVEKAEHKVIDYKASNNIVDAIGQNVIEQQLVSAGTRLGDARARAAEARSRYDQVRQAQRSGDIGAIPEALRSQTISGLRTQLTEVMRHEGDLAATLGQRHPLLNEARAQETTVKKLLNEELARIAAVSKSDLDRALADETAAETTYRSLEAKVTSTGQLSVRLSELERAAQTSRTVYEAFLARTRQVGEQEKLDTTNISIISPAQIPETKSWPPKPLYVLAAALTAGLGLGIGLICGLELLVRRRLGPVWLGTLSPAR